MDEPGAVAARTVARLLLLAAAGASCRTVAVQREDPRPPIVQPGAPGEAARVIAAEQAADLSHVQYVGADITFMQGMIGHHAQALEMTALVAARAASDDVRTLALRIEISQEDEIKMMQGWLAERGQRVPTGREHHVHGATLMPGMLTPEEMERLAAATGAAFDRSFLEFMIKHHDGALVMVQDLFSTPGAGQASDVFAFASEVEADQRMEIERMGAMLKELHK